MVALHRVEGSTVVKAMGLDVDLPVVAIVAVKDQVPVAAGGLAWRDRRCFIWFHVEQPDSAYRFTILRECRKMLNRARQLGETEVFTIRDPRIETSPRLLKICGFEFHAVENDLEIYRCET